MDSHTSKQTGRQKAEAPPSTGPRGGMPLWLEAVRRFERKIGVPVERLVRSDVYFETLATVRRTQAQMTELVAGLTNDWYRVLNMPTGSEVRRIHEQLSRLERQLEQLTRELREREPAKSSAPRPKRPSS